MVRPPSSIPGLRLRRFNEPKTRWTAPISGSRQAGSRARPSSSSITSLSSAARRSRTGIPLARAPTAKLGSDGTADPRPGNIPTLFVMTPIGFRPAEATLQCPIVGHCINHPSTIDLSRVFGAGTENAPLPAHSHIVDQAEGNWWELDVVGVKDRATWDQIVAGKNLPTVQPLQAADPSGAKITGDIPTNVYLFFDVRPGSSNP